MNIISDKNFDHKKVVIEGYNKCSNDYAEARYVQTEPSLKLLTDRIPIGASVLDIGCGAGIPVAKILSDTYKVTGVDISEKQIELAKLNVPKADFIHQDILDFDFGNTQWDAIVSYYAIFHLSKKDQLILFDKAICGLKAKGYLLFTLTLDNEQAYTEDDFFGTTMYWDNYSLTEYEEVLTDKGIKILYSGKLNHGYNDEYEGKEETHPILLGLKEEN